MGTDIHGIFQKRTESGWEDVVAADDILDRNYTLFAWIGNVRNGVGFSGIVTHSPIEPLTDGRGLPDDFQFDGDYHLIPSNAHRGGMADYYTADDNDTNNPGSLKLWLGDHSHSWVSADEVLNATPLRILRSGIVPIEFYRNWDGQSEPDSWCGYAAGDFVSVANSPSEVTDQTSHVRIEWFSDLAEELKYFFDEVRRLKDEHGEVRFVFGFDS
jgi:hypothetical protein